MKYSKFKSEDNSQQHHSHHNNHHGYHHHHQQQQQHHHHHHGLMSAGKVGSGGGAAALTEGRSGSGRVSLSLASSSKRNKKHNWGARERTGMSFLIVIAFFAVFGMIILTELFMIDERAHGGMMVLRNGNGYYGRMGDSMPDYDNVKDDYDLLDAGILNDNRLGFVQFQDNKFKIQDAENNNANGGGRAGVLLNSQSVGGGNTYAGVGGLSASALGGNGPLIPWGKMLPSNVEDSLPRFPSGMPTTDGSWQIVNGTRFKFFVFSAYYDRRDGGKLVRIVGATKTRGPERVWCRFWYNETMKKAANEKAGGGAAGGSKDKFSSATVMARVKVIRENWNLKYSACFILCPVRPQEYDVPHYVSVVSRLRAPPGNILELRNTDWDRDIINNRRKPALLNRTNLNYEAKGPPIAQLQSPVQFPMDLLKGELAVCVKPFHFNYNQALYIMEYLELYALMGVAHFTFYNHTIGPHAECVLQHYVQGDIPERSTAHDSMPQKKYAEDPPSASSLPLQYQSSLNFQKPTVEILPWNLRMRSQKEIRTEGLFAALNDCLYRSMYRYKYVALVDLDEFIVPRHNDTLLELLESLNYRFRNRNTGAYSFQNAFFYLQFADDPLVAKPAFEGESLDLQKLRAALVTQRKTRRRYKLHPQKQRSKYICKPEAVVEAGNHFVWEYSPGKGSLNVPPTDAILQHYRVCEFGGNDCIKAPSTVDRTATKYVNRLMERVYNVYKYLKPKCKLPELPAIPKIETPKPEMKPIIRKVRDEERVQQQQLEVAKDEVAKHDKLTIKIKENAKINEKTKENDKQKENQDIKKTNDNEKVKKLSEKLNKKDLSIKTTKATMMIMNQNKTGLQKKAQTTSDMNKIIAAKPLKNKKNIVTTTVTTTAASTTITATTTTTTAGSTTNLDTSSLPPTQPLSASLSSQNSNPLMGKRKHKVVVFFVDEHGNPKARLEYH